MVCIRCKMLVKDELTKLGISYTSVELGEAQIDTELSPSQYDKIKSALLVSGLELMDDKKSILIQNIKKIIIELVHYSEEPLDISFSRYLARKLGHDYAYLSNLFSGSQGISIEKFLIAHKIERVKELLVYESLSLTEIAYRMHYSSVAQLSTQFKKVTGLTPSYFKQLKVNRLSVPGAE
jgi:YesN/AraC family two-component response regulator